MLKKMQVPDIWSDQNASPRYVLAYPSRRHSRAKTFGTWITPHMFHRGLFWPHCIRKPHIYIYPSRSHWKARTFGIWIAPLCLIVRFLHGSPWGFFHGLRQPRAGREKMPGHAQRTASENLTYPLRNHWKARTSGIWIAPHMFHHEVFTWFIARFFHGLRQPRAGRKKMPDTHAALHQKTLHVHHGTIQRPEPSGPELPPYMCHREDKTARRTHLTKTIENSATAPVQEFSICARRGTRAPDPKKNHWKFYIRAGKGNRAPDKKKTLKI